jgi:hypothetical protein
MIKAVSTAFHAAGKPLKRLNVTAPQFTGLKPGVNEITNKYPGLERCQFKMFSGGYL